MTYVQRFPFPPAPELSGRTIALLIVGSLHVLVVGLIVNELATVRRPDGFTPVPVTLLPAPVEPLLVRHKLPTVEPGVVVLTIRPVEPVLNIEETEKTPEVAEGLVATNEGAVATPETGPVARVLPRQDPDHPLGRPAYPPTSIRLNETGRVLLNVCVDITGRTTAVRVMSSSGYPRLDQAAVKHLRRPATRLLPGTESGQPVAMCADLPIRFGFDLD